jgi:hypothetical protein
LIVTEGSGAAGSSVAVDLMAHEALVVDAALHGVRRAASMEVVDFMAARCTVAAGSMVVAVSTLEEASTVAEVEDSTAAAGTGKFRPRPDLKRGRAAKRQRLAAEGCRPFLLQEGPL